MSNCVLITFLRGILGQMAYLIVSIPDLCPLSDFSLLIILFIWFVHFIDCLYHVLPQLSTYYYVSTADDIVNIKATICNCIVVAHLTKLAISIFLGKMEGNL